MTHDELIERVTKATGPDRELDGLLWRALTNKPGDVWEEIDGQWCRRQDPDDPVKFFESPALTASIDAALALTERKLPGVWWIMSKGKLTHDEALFACQLLFGADESLAIEDGPTAPLAIILALLNAKKEITNVL